MIAVNDIQADHAEDLLADVWKIGRAWTEMAGGYDELHIVRFPGGKFVARWGARGGNEGEGQCIVDAVLSLKSKLECEVREWTKDDARDLGPALEASLR